MDSALVGHLLKHDINFQLHVMDSKETPPGVTIMYIDFQLHVMDSAGSVSRQGRGCGLSTPCNGFERLALPEEA